ncbi:MAG: hypothetical protein ACR2PG_27385 [Hyphomicrobiaceae bacterium]
MLAWLRRYVAWLFVAVGVAGCVSAVRAWQTSAYIRDVKERGKVAVALIERASAAERKAALTYTVALAWKDGAGRVHRVGAVPISRSFANEIIDDGKLVVPSVRIRYLSDNQLASPVIIADAEAQRKAALWLLGIGVIATIIGSAGAFIFGMRLAQNQGKSG